MITCITCNHHKKSCSTTYYISLLNWSNIGDIYIYIYHIYIIWTIKCQYPFFCLCQIQSKLNINIEYPWVEIKTPDNQISYSLWLDAVFFLKRQNGCVVPPVFLQDRAIKSHEFDVRFMQNLYRILSKVSPICA